MGNKQWGMRNGESQKQKNAPQTLEPDLNRKNSVGTLPELPVAGHDYLHGS